MKKFFTLLLLLLFAPLLAAQTCWNTIPESTPSERFRIDGNEVVDLLTGLVWQRCPLGLSGSDCQHGSLDTRTWRLALSDARDLAARENKGWRLPTIKELRSIVEERCLNPAINYNLFPNTVPTGITYNIRFWRYWSASPHIPVPIQDPMACADGGDWEPCPPSIALLVCDQNPKSTEPSSLYCGSINGLRPNCCQKLDPPELVCTDSNADIVDDEGNALPPKWEFPEDELCPERQELLCNDLDRSPPTPSCDGESGVFSLSCPPDATSATGQPELICCTGEPPTCPDAEQPHTCHPDIGEPFCARWQVDDNSDWPTRMETWGRAWTVDSEDGRSLLHRMDEGLRVRFVRDY